MFFADSLVSAELLWESVFRFDQLFDVFGSDWLLLLEPFPAFLFSFSRSSVPLEVEDCSEVWLDETDLGCLSGKLKTYTLLLGVGLTTQPGRGAKSNALNRLVVPLTVEDGSSFAVIGPRSSSSGD